MTFVQEPKSQGQMESGSHRSEPKAGGDLRCDIWNLHCNVKTWESPLVQDAWIFRTDTKTAQKEKNKAVEAPFVQQHP